MESRWNSWKPPAAPERRTPSVNNGLGCFREFLVAVCKLAALIFVVGAEIPKALVLS
jgi:hypothetical protein